MEYIIGIDTGGTYTDAVIVEKLTKKIIFSQKTLTTKYNLEIGINNILLSIRKKFSASLFNSVSHVSLSTTLATNAIAEGRGCKVCLILIGYDKKLLRKFDFFSKFESEHVFIINGKYNIKGDEIIPLDENALLNILQNEHKKTEVFAVSGFFSSRNPSHEIRAKKIIEKHVDTPITCGHLLSNRLDSVKRAINVTLNARLIPIINELIKHVKTSLKKMEISAPLMVVKGDGTLVSDNWAVAHPIETIISGPAASAVGASNLTNLKKSIVIDMGGTTTDITFLEDGVPRTNPNGSIIGGRKTLFEAIDTYTIGIGGDSHIQIDDEKNVQIGPQKVIPLCLFSEFYPNVVDKIIKQKSTSLWHKSFLQFITMAKKPNCSIEENDLNFLKVLEKDQIPLCSLYNDPKSYSLLNTINRLETYGYTQISGFTLTDALHVLDIYNNWNKKASYLGATIISKNLNTSPEQFCKSVIEKAKSIIIKNVLKKTIAPYIKTDKSDVNNYLFQFFNLFFKENDSHSEIEFQCTLKRPVIGIGAPIKTYLENFKNFFKTDIIFPSHYKVANAVGAALSKVILKYNIIISTNDNLNQFRVHLPYGFADFKDHDSAVAYTKNFMDEYLKKQGKIAGTNSVEISMTIKENKGCFAAGSIEEIYLNTELNFQAVGFPGTK